MYSYIVEWQPIPFGLICFIIFYDLMINDLEMLFLNFFIKVLYWFKIIYWKYDVAAIILFYLFILYVISALS